MKTKKRKNYSPWPVVLICLVFLALRIADLMFFTDPETSFPTQGSSALRWGAALAGAAVILAVSSRADNKIRSDRGGGLGIPMIAAGTFLVLAGLAQLLNFVTVWPSMVLQTAAGIWFLLLGWQEIFTARKSGKKVPPNAVQCVIPTAALLWVLVRRFSIIPAASARLACTFRVLGALGALLCVGMLCKIIYVPGGEYGRAVQQWGSLGFYFATCHELPQAVYELLNNTATTAELLTSLAIGCIGLCGLAAMFTTVPRNNRTKKDTAD